MISRCDLIDTPHFQTSHWRSICDLTLTLKQARKLSSGSYVKLDEIQCKAALRHFMRLLNRAVFGSAARRHNKRLKIIPILEKDADGRWNLHAAVEPPAHLDPIELDELVRACWSKTDWGYKHVFLRDNADRGWINYILKQRQKSGLEAWSDCIDWETFYNPLVDA